MKNLLSLGQEVVGIDINEEYKKWVEENLKIKTYTDALNAIRDEKPNVCFVCTPPSSHVPIAKLAIENDLHVFIEKPISSSFEGLDELLKIAKEKNLKITVGYNLRFNRSLKKIKELLSSRAIGKILYARILFGYYLPSWRPWQDYRKSYTASKDLGGGIILDGSHELDYALWFFGDPKEVNCTAEKVSDLEVETEDIAEINIKFPEGAIVNIHLDFLRHDYARNCEIIGEKGTIKWDYTKASVELYDIKNKQTELFELTEDPNDTYLKEIKHFIDCIEKDTDPLVTAEEAKKTLHLVLKAKEAAEKRKTIKVD